MTALHLPLLAGLLALGQVAPAPPIVVRVSPAMVRVDVERGQESSFDILLGNEGSQPLSVESFVGDLQLTADGLPVICEPGSQPQSCAAWITLDRPPPTIAPGTTATVAAHLHVPAGARGGGYGVIGFRIPVRPDASGDDQVTVAVEGVTGAVVMLRVKGPVNMRAQVERVAALRDEVAGAINLEADLRNTGDVHLRCSGEIVITDPDRRVAARVPLEAGTGTVLPGGMRTLRAAWQPRAPLAPGQYHASARITVENWRTVRGNADFTVPQ